MIAEASVGVMETRDTRGATEVQVWLGPGEAAALELLADALQSKRRRGTVLRHGVAARTQDLMAILWARKLARQIRHAQGGEDRAAHVV